MRKHKLPIIVAVIASLIAACAMLFVGCGETGEPAEQQPQATISLGRNSVELAVGETTTVVATVTGTEASVTWSSSDAGVVRVDSGQLVAVSAGNATVTASVENVSASVAVRVADNNMPVVSLGRTAVELTENGDAFTLDGTVTYGGKTVESKLDWRSDNESVVTVSDGVLTPVSTGSATVTASTEYFGKYAQATVAVSVASATRLTLSQETVALKYIQNPEAQVTAEMKVKGEIADAVFSADVTGDAVTVAVDGNTVTITAAKVGVASVSVTGIKGNERASASVSVTVERGEKDTEYRFTANTHHGDVKLDMPGSDGASGIYDGDKLISTGDPLTLGATWLAGQQAGTEKKVKVELPNYYAAVTVKFTDEVRYATFHSFQCSVGDPEDGEGKPGFVAGDRVQTWTTGPLVGWYSTIELMTNGERGDIHGYDRWIFDIVFTGDLALESETDKNWLLFILGGSGYETYVTETGVVVRGGSQFDGVYVYDSNGDPVTGIPQKNVRYTVVVDIQKAHQEGQYCLMGIFTPEHTSYIGNSIVCTDEYYADNINDRFIRVALDKESAECYVNETVTLKATVTNSEQSVVWSSSDDSIATVENGVVTAHKSGKAIITATAGERSAACEITVSDKVEILFGTSQLTVAVEKSDVIPVTVKCNGVEVTPSSLAYKSDDEAIATVVDGRVTGVNVGTTTVEVTAVYAGVTAKKSISVRVAESSYVAVSDANLTVYSFEWNDLKTSAVVTATMYVMGERVDGATFTATSNNDGVATARVNGNEIEISAVKPGTAEITVGASKDGETVSTTVSVTVELSVITSEKRFTANTHYGDSIIDLSGYGVASGIYDGDALVSAIEKPLSLKADWLAAQTKGTNKTLQARFEACNVNITVDFIDEVHYATFLSSQCTADPVEDGEGKPGFVAGDRVQSWTTGPMVGWYSVIELRVNDISGDIHDYDWWMFDIVFTGDLALESDTDRNWLLFIFGERGYETYVTESGEAIRGGAPFDGVHVYDENGDPVTGLPQKNVRYTVIVDVQKSHQEGQYCVMGNYTPYMTSYIGNNIVCTDEYYVNNIRNKYARVTLDKNSAECYINETVTLNATVTNSGDPVVWSSSDSTVATVDNGVVTAHKSGTAVITATAGERSAACEITVSDKVEILFGVSQLTVVIENSDVIPVTVKCNGVEVTPSSLVYNSADETIASVDSGRVTGVSVGTTTVEVTAVYAGVTVKKSISVRVVQSSYVSISDEELTLYTYAGQNKDTSAVVTATMYVKGELADGAFEASVSGDAVAVTVDGNTVTITAVKAGSATVTVTGIKDDERASASVSATVMRGEKDTGYRFTVNIHYGDAKLEKSELDGATGIYDGDERISTDNSLTISETWLAGQQAGSAKKVRVVLPDYDATVTLDFADEARYATFYDFQCSADPMEDGEGKPGFVAGDRVQPWTTGPWVGWYSTIELKVNGVSGDIHGYDWWVFDIVFTGDLALESDTDRNWLLFILGGGGYETYVTETGDVIRGGSHFDGVYVYDENGNAVTGIPQKNVRYTVVVDIQKSHQEGQYCLMGNFTPNMTSYIGNNVVCSDAYYKAHFAGKFARAAAAQQSERTQAPTARASEVAYKKSEE